MFKKIKGPTGYFQPNRTKVQCTLLGTGVSRVILSNAWKTEWCRKLNPDKIQSKCLSTSLPSGPQMVMYIFEILSENYHNNQSSCV